MIPYSSHWFLFSTSFALLKKYSLICASTKISWCACSITASIDLLFGSLNRSSSSNSASFSSSIVFSATGSIGMIHSSSSARLMAHYPLHYHHHGSGATKASYQELFNSGGQSKRAPESKQSFQWISSWC